jgi:glycosyltransferase involved in cell wall biosynthesis
MYQITIGIATYNSASFVEDTLRSIFNQIYTDIHLIFSDDFSTDETNEIVKNWIGKESVKDRFLSIQFLTVDKNTGVSANCNRIIAASKTEWIKFIAGDDILLPNCIQDNVNFIIKTPDAKILFSQVEVYNDTFEKENYQRSTPEEFPLNLFNPTFSAEDQFKILCECDRIHFTPSYMFHKSAVLGVGGYDETERLVEDYPMWLKLTKAGFKLDYFHIPTVGYRIHKNATNNTGEVLFKPSVINGFKVRRKYAHAHLNRIIVLSEYWGYYISKLFMFFKIEKPTKLNKIAYKILMVYFNPFVYIVAIQKRLR